MLRALGVICLVGVIIGPVVWIGDLLGLRTPWVSVREAFVLMLAALFTANAVVIAHLAVISDLRKRQKWNWLHRVMSPVAPFVAFEYLWRSGAPR